MKTYILLLPFGRIYDHEQQQRRTNKTSFFEDFFKYNCLTLGYWHMTKSLKKRKKRKEGKNITQFVVRLYPSSVRFTPSHLHTFKCLLFVCLMGNVGKYHFNRYSLYTFRMKAKVRRDKLWCNITGRNKPRGVRYIPRLL